MRLYGLPPAALSLDLQPLQTSKFFSTWLFHRSPAGVQLDASPAVHYDGKLMGTMSAYKHYTRNMLTEKTPGIRVDLAVYLAWPHL